MEKEKKIKKVENMTKQTLIRHLGKIAEENVRLTSENKKLENQNMEYHKKLGEIGSRMETFRTQLIFYKGVYKDLLDRIFDKKYPK